MVFRPNKSCHTAIIALNQAVMTKSVNFVVEVDIRNFFDNVSHYWLLRCLEERISDPSICRLFGFATILLLPLRVEKMQIFLLTELRERFAKFGLEVAEEKTQLIEFGKKAFEKHKRKKTKLSSFKFLGFTHFMKKSRFGLTIMGHKTSKENLRRKLQTIKEWLKIARAKISFNEWIPILKAKLTGHYNYFGLSGNYRCLKQFYK
jgi:hypothetical protein